MTSLAALFQRWAGCSSLFQTWTIVSQGSLVLSIDALVTFDKSVGLILCRQVWPSVAIWSLVRHRCCYWVFCISVTKGGHLVRNYLQVGAPEHISTSSVSEVVTLVRGNEGSCQADGCQSDMAKQSVWHQKSRICDKHMSGMFLKSGNPQQFCQQCGRSHNLDAFDQGRKSCRTQLAKHAARFVSLITAVVYLSAI